VILALALAAVSLQRFEAVEPHMGTLARIVVYAESEAQADAALRAGFARLREIDARLSDYQPDSELNRVSTKRTKVSDDLWRVLQFAQRLAQASGGAFDVTLGTRTRAWREGRASDGAYGWRHLHLDERTHEVWLDTPGIRLDLGGIAKGYAAHEALTAIARHGATRALVALSGDIAAGDPPPGEPGWKVRIPNRAEPLLLVKQAVSTSGESEQFKATGSHIHDGRSGTPLQATGTISVIAADGMTADALATAIRILGRERGQALARQFRATLY
jgi:thiamine biosynthesis lipoprotein